VLDANDAPLGDGEPGELAVRPRHPFSVASGYFGMPAQTLAAWRNLWFHTGERVVRDGDGWFRLVAPTPDAISRLGESVPLVEVERVLQDHPAVAAVAVFRAPGHVKDDLMAAVVPEPGADLDPFELIQFCEPRIARFAIPRYVEFITALPLTELGAVRTAELRERGIGPTTWDRERMSPQLIR
jgi:crotonobetaine/carnitine-CoA ligase